MDGLARYSELRRRVEEFIRTADELVAREARLSGSPKSDKLEKLAEKVAGDCFELVVTGTFQSGKSTLFNYLCGGRELSKVGCGIATSFCKMRVHFVKSAEEEKAELTWCTADQLLLRLAYRQGSKGKPEHPSSRLDLDNEASRRRFLDATWKKWETSGTGRDSLRIPLLIAEYYPRYRARCGRVDAVPFQRLSRVTAYPEEWDTRWGEVQGRHALPFDQDEVGFAFLSEVNLHVHSPELARLGCSFTDTPGLDASMGDTMEATECMQRADAVLFTFSGAKTPTEEETKNLSLCKDIGVQGKLLLGANLKIPREKWEEKIEGEVKKSISRLGSMPEKVYAYHAALALCAKELMHVENHTLSPETAEALDNKLGEGSPCTLERKKEFLEERINKYLRKLCGKSLDDYRSQGGIRYDALERESGVPDMIASVAEIMAPARIHSILIDRGVRPTMNTLGKIKFRSGKLQNILSKDIRQAREELDRKEEQLRQFEKKRKAAIDILQVQAEKCYRNVTAHFRERARQIFASREMLFLYFWNKHLNKRASKERKAAFISEISVLMQQMLQDLRDELVTQFNKMEDFVELRRCYEQERLRLRNEVKELYELDALGIVEESIMVNPGKLASIMLKSMGAAFRAAEIANRKVKWWILLPWPIYYLKKASLTQKVYRQNREVWCKLLEDAIGNALESDDGPYSQIRGTLARFSKAFNRPHKEHLKVRREFEHRLLAATNKEEDIAAYGRMEKQAKELCEQGKTLYAECKALCYPAT